MARYTTTAAYLSGGICGCMWMPAAMAGKPLKKDLRGPWGFMQKGDTFLEAIRSLNMQEGGDFQNPLFTADTVIRIERRRIDGPGKYSTHCREISLARLVPEYVDGDVETWEFFGEED